MEVFWGKGYEAATIQNLVDGMGVQRGSLYAAFGDKHGLYMHALEQYTKSIVEPHLQAMGDVRDGLPALHRFFDDVLRFSLTEEGRRGCLLTNSVAELGNCDDRVAAELARISVRLEDQFFTVLENARRLGQIDPQCDCKAQARYLLMALNGFRVTVKLQRDPIILRQLVDQILASINLGQHQP